MKEIVTILLFVFMLPLGVSAQTPDFFTPYRSTHLRLPSVPLVVNDPYFSIWSPYDHLTDGPTVHWTGSPKPLDGLLRVDGTVYRFMGASDKQIQTALQKSVSVLATNTYYSFDCGPVELDLVFTAPMLIHNLDLISTPVNYISYQVRSKDKKDHAVQIYLSVSPEIARNTAEEGIRSRTVDENGMEFLESGTIEQPILAQKGDGICINWGYVYLPAVNGKVSLGPGAEVRKHFVSSGQLPAGEKEILSYKDSTLPVLAYVHDFGQVSSPSSGFTMLGYDEVEDIEYMYHRYKGYWARDGKTIFEAFKSMENSYSSIMNQCRSLDKTIYDDGLNSGNVQYAEMLSGSYRHVMAAHKLFEDKDGHLLFFSKENNSNGCVNTVDLTYPEAPLFLCYNPTLEKAMMTSIFEYSKSGRYRKPFAAHDQGTYPIADGQVYGGDMPVEESGNMLILSSMLSQLDGNTHYVDRYWDQLSTWVNYLVENGEDPSNQLCTDDFAGHWAHNCNLSVKAIMGIEGYARMAALRGEQRISEKYDSIARGMSQWWVEHANDGNHYRLSFDRPDTWSQKYNMVWDQLWAAHLFPKGAKKREISYYLKHQNKYGLPLDCRKTYTKSDWIMWTAAMSPNTKTFLKFMSPVFSYINETLSRVPISDWHETTDGKMVGFKARSVIGGYWMKVFSDKMLKQEKIISSGR
jgi:hypothetical protein